MHAQDSLNRSLTTTRHSRKYARNTTISVWQDSEISRGSSFVDSLFNQAEIPISDDNEQTEGNVKVERVEAGANQNPQRSRTEFNHEGFTFQFAMLSQLIMVVQPLK